MYKEELALNNLQVLICHKTNKQTINKAREKRQSIASEAIGE